MAKLGLVLFIVFNSLTAAADFYQGIRQMGMGGAAVAVVNDETSLLLNPIGLGRLREPYMTLIDPEVTTNRQSINNVQNLLADAVDVEKIYQELANDLDQRYFARAQMFPSFVNRNYGVGALMRYEVTATRSSSTQFLNLNYISDWAVAAGYNKSFYGGVIKLGIAGRLIDRVEATGDVDPAVQGLDAKNIGVEGLGLATDVGLSLSSPTDWLPTLSILARDIGDTSFTLSDGMRSYPTTSDPSKIPMKVDVAAAVFPIWSKWTRGTFTVQYDDVLESSGSSQKKLHAGVEVNLSDRLFLRGGWNRGYATCGLEWASQFFQVQLAYYGEEVGTDDLPIRDERFSLKTVLRF